jgi:DNA (cytosine-5)-methyltransferase 1
MDKVICEKRCDEGIRFFKDDICGSLRTIDSCGDKRVIEADAIKNLGGTKREFEGELRIRKLTPKECYRLMAFDDTDFEKAEKVNSNTQLYKQAGNSIVVTVLEHLFKQLFDCGVL